MSIQTTPEADQATGVIPAAPWRVKALSVLPDYRLAVTFMDGTTGIADFSSRADCQGMRNLRNTQGQGLFRSGAPRFGRGDLAQWGGPGSGLDA